jgi:hypothetical protein
MGTSKGKSKKLGLNKETLKDLSPGSGDVKGGLGKGGGTAAACSNPCPATKLLCPHKTTVPAGCPSTVTRAGCGVLG